METQDFVAFDRLCQVLHFHRASKSLGMSPSALTRRIQALEQELGRPLFLRDQRRVELTPAGELFRDFVRGELNRLDELKSAILEDEASPAGELRVACTVTACHSVLPRLLAECRKRHPKIRVRLVTQDATRSLEELERGDVDLAVVPSDPDEHRQLETRILGHTDLVFVGPLVLDEWGGESLLTGPPETPEELGALPIVAPLGGHERKRLDGYFRARGAVPNIVAEVRGNEGALALVSLGSGLSLVPRLVLDQSALRQRVRQLEAWQAPPGYDIALCAEPKTLRRAVARAFWLLDGGDPLSNGPDASKPDASKPDASQPDAPVSPC
jgi:LysR family transcriptional regulator, positive regulator for ilvC